MALSPSFSRIATKNSCSHSRPAQVRVHPGSDTALVRVNAFDVQSRLANAVFFPALPDFAQNANAPREDSSEDSQVSSTVSTDEEFQGVDEEFLTETQFRRKRLSKQQKLRAKKDAAKVRGSFVWCITVYITIS